MSAPLLTADMIAEDDTGCSACPEGLAFFKKRYPRGMRLTPDNVAQTLAAVDQYNDTHYAQIAVPIPFVAWCLFSRALQRTWRGVRGHIYDSERQHNNTEAEAFLAVLMAWDDIPEVEVA